MRERGRRHGGWGYDVRVDAQEGEGAGQADQAGEEEAGPGSINQIPYEGVYEREGQGDLEG